MATDTHSTCACTHTLTHTLTLTHTHTHTADCYKQVLYNCYLYIIIISTNSNTHRCKHLVNSYNSVLHSY